MKPKLWKRNVSKNIRKLWVSKKPIKGKPFSVNHNVTQNVSQEVYFKCVGPFPYVKTCPCADEYYNRYGKLGHFASCSRIRITLDSKQSARQRQDSRETTDKLLETKAKTAVLSIMSNDLSHNTKSVNQMKMLLMKSMYLILINVNHLIQPIYLLWTTNMRIVVQFRLNQYIKLLTAENLKSLELLTLTTT